MKQTVHYPLGQIHYECLVNVLYEHLVNFLHISVA
jgi:hypothetical protein